MGDVQVLVVKGREFEEGRTSGQDEGRALVASFASVVQLGRRREVAALVASG